MTLVNDQIVLVDSHCHIDFPELAGDISGVLERMAEAQVNYALCVSVNMSDFPRVLALATRYEQIFASVGVHPDATDGPEPTVTDLVQEGGNPRVVAVGETGLDYFRASGDLEWQRERFRTHIRAARELNKPLIIHCREASQDLLRIMREENVREVGGVMHCFTESWDVAAAAIGMNFAISFSGIVTFKSAANLREVAARVPAEQLLVETDSPYLAPVPFRGKTNQPAFVRHVAEGLARARGTSLVEVATATTANFFRIFNAQVT
ncbi:MAG: TatD family deoxyribonuclease [Betaproteobacteria bacterium]|nr:MAG: TatD family deoxyribonuclease [Betaproteobacteria bacterium]